MATPEAPTLPPRWWWGFAVYGVVSVIHITLLLIPDAPLAGPTKLLLMPLLAIAVIWAGRGSGWGIRYVLLFVALALSWLGDGAATFFPFLDDELPAMLLCFGLAHIAYIVLFWRYLAVRRLPLWSAVYVVWWIVLVLFLWPSLGGLAVAVAVYGLVLGGTAVLSTRCHPAVAWGGAFFLVSDTVLAFEIFLSDRMPAGTGALVMLTYCLGQGLIAAGVVLSRRRAPVAASTAVTTRPAA